ncbi:hypothetical protein IF1G_02342 [Cordyceps javanica]|uniref:Uncharacterized protein n=1 Tax=Cordyceps javanica TaxID=43265 RepID=A0A545V964_9HYPO|nr:hypothetical protein IF1G_02342 [Cordyceps javanica]
MDCNALPTGRLPQNMLSLKSIKIAGASAGSARPATESQGNDPCRRNATCLRYQVPRYLAASQMQWYPAPGSQGVTDAPTYVVAGGVKNGGKSCQGLCHRSSHRTTFGKMADHSSAPCLPVTRKPDWRGNWRRD